MSDIDEPIVSECLCSRRLTHAGCDVLHERTLYPESSLVEYISACATDGDETVASMTGYYAYQGAFHGPHDLVEAMDDMTQEAYDVAEFVLNLGSRVWARRSGILFIDEAFTEASHRRRGLMSAMSRAVASELRRPRCPLLVVVQPWPSGLALKGTDHDWTRPVLMPSQWKREMARVTSIWLRIFPWLNNSGYGGLRGDRVYHYGFAP